MKVQGLGHIFSHLPGASSAASPDVKIAQIRMFAAPQLALPLAFPCLIFAYAWSLYDKAPLWALLLWASLVSGFHFLNYLLSRRFLRTHVQPETVGRWLQKFVLINICFTTSFGSMLWLFWNPADATLQTYLMLTMTIVLAPATLVSVPSMPIFYANTLPLVTALGARLVLYVDLFHVIGVFMLMALMGLLTHLALQMNKAIEKSIRLREEKSALVDELFRAKRDSDFARARAEETSRAKSRFLANMSHELRTPLNAIIGFSELMEGELLGPHKVPAYKGYATDIKTSGQHLLGLINDILDLSRIEAGQLQISDEELDPVQIAEDCRHLMQIRADAQDITLVTDYAADLPMLRGDKRALRQIWINLLTNAVKFSSPGTEIKMLISRDENGDLRFGVHDQGVGISESEISKVVEAFQQGAAGLAQAGNKGTGLGLSIVKGLLEAHGGRFELKSKLGKGTQAEAVLPASRLLKIPARPADAGDTRIAG